MCEIKGKRSYVSFICCAFITLTQAQAQTQLDNQSALNEEQQEQKQLVQDLIQSENQRLSQPTVASKSVSQARNADPDYVGADLVLKAMYGVDNRILAEISFRGKPYLYLRGQAWPIGDHKGQSQLRLLSMSSRCIRLAHKDDQFDACVLPQGGQP